MKVHMVAICGTGMGALAGLMKESGREVKGSDKAFYPPMSERLRAWNIPTLQGFDPAHIDPDTDLVIVGNACRKNNPEARAAIDGGMRVMSFPQALSELFIEGRRSIVIAGTHGKTTTTAMLSYLLVENGKDPSFLVGGIPRDYGKSFRFGQGPDFVVEGDEYDSAFFDKRPKFIHYRPEVAVLTSLEFDHADIYDDLDDYKSAYFSLIDKMPERCLLVACDDYRHVREVSERARCEVVHYGLGNGDGWRAEKAGSSDGKTVLELYRDGKRAGKLKSPLPGDHNVANLLAVVAVAERLDLKIPRDLLALEKFGGIARRMEVRGVSAGVTVIDDFAHHPTEVQSTVQAAREQYPESQLVAVFEPRTNTSRRSFFQERYADSFTGADRVAVVPPYGIDDIAEEDRFDSSRLVRELTDKGLSARYFAGVTEVVDDLARTVPDGGVVLVMSNGAFGNIHDKLIKALRSREEAQE